MVAELSGDGIAELTEIVSLAERVEGIAHEETVFPFHDAEPTNHELVVEHDAGDGFHVSEGRPFRLGERVDEYVRDCEAVERGGVVSHFGCSHCVPLVVDCELNAVNVPGGFPAVVENVVVFFAFEIFGHVVQHLFGQFFEPGVAPALQFVHDVCFLCHGESPWSDC